MFTPQYQITEAILKKLSEIAEIKAEVGLSRLLPAREAFLRRSAVIKMAHTSTSIEGNTLQEYQVKQVADGKRVNAEPDQITEVKNYLTALTEVDRLAGASTFGKKEILTIHKKTMGGLAGKQAGVFRTGPVYVVNVLPGGSEELAYTPPTANRVPILIGELLKWLNQTQQTHPVIRAGLFHYQFETIHPFLDGNGRTGRLLTLLHLYQSGWNFRKVLVLEDYYNRNRKQYYQALQTGETYSARQGADLTTWIEYFVDGFWEETLRVKEQILTLQAMGKGEKAEVRLDNAELKIVDFLVTVGQITSSDVVDILQVPRRTAQARLKRLEKMRVVEKKGAGPATYWQLVKP